MIDGLNPTAQTAAGPEPAPAEVVAPSFLALSLGSVGVVYGDIGTSPLYAFREAVIAASETGGLNRDVVLGVVSPILMARFDTVNLK
jgi:KUP system potassium uptake protein